MSSSSPNPRLAIEVGLSALHVRKREDRSRLRSRLDSRQEREKF